MALIEFKDYPNTSTPLNAENLNNNFNELKNKISEIPMKIIAENYNIDELKTSGVYGIFNATGTLPNGFSITDNNIFVQCFMWWGGYGRQILHDVRTNNSYSRNLNNETWLEWKKITIE